ncbi:Acyl-CoA synthetase (AMP-forming)/AMP-acid ligase II [Pseudonocardia thermophila]|mgnify:CR=1 FL=1|jgi:Acyl-CoA synthetases (AMP-forming)/AMP-acid ligases II|uniref:Acyl-CoA synthetase (AMP-forming)/AMP-acid ligase II n=1 Tax=Pseudonocardia thermophila TaxID=1848 RepID=A0A1M6YB34_PSETH|nr:4-coumarate--CoA ligase family protein [Pseudonocardia thermophila]SHL15507.1 Acyl-CoA synthetase (AMP-forming)/AMP-acid ligase II [Pseudonocardia thermophila]
MSFRSTYPDVEIPDTSLYEFLFTDFGDRADAPAVIDGPTGNAITFRQLHELVDKVAAGLAARGIGKGDVVALFAPNNPYWVAAFHGIIRANATVTSANSLYTAPELVHQLKDSGARMIITVSPFLDRASAAAAEVGIPDDAIITLDPAEGRTSLAELAATDAAPPALEVGAEDVAVLPYSSGTTGLAKGVILTHRNLVANLCQVEPVFSVTPERRLLAVLPFFHIYGMTVMMNNGLYHRSTVVTMPKFEPQEFLRVISEHRVDYVYIAPPVAVFLAKHPIVDQYDLSCIDTIFSGAAPLDAELGHAVEKRLGCRVLQGYGMTELSPVSHAHPFDSTYDLNSVGLAIPNTECKLVDPETGKEVGPGERGELWVKGPQVMRGYLNNPEATAATLDADGFLHTGDVATVTEDGVYTIVDRVKELIKYKGYQVPPAELEALLLTNPRIADAAVIGVRDEEGEEVPKAFVVKQPGAEDLTEDEVMAYVAERIAPHKKVRVVEFIDAIPKSASGKILRKDLRAREAQKV